MQSVTTCEWNFHSSPRSMTYTCNYGTSSSSFKYPLKNVLNHHFIASELMFFPLKALQFAVSSYVTKIQNLWPETAWGERLHRQFPRGLMCFQSGDHLFRCLMSSVINKCMALISLRVAGALELVWSCGDGGSMPARLLLEMVIRAWGGGLWADALALCWWRLLMIPSFHLNLLSCFSPSSPWPVEGLISDSGPNPGQTLICFFKIIRSEWWN